MINTPQTPDDEIEIESESNEPDDESLVEYDIASYPSDYTLETLYSQWKKGNIVIPEFQREFVWDIEQASLLIDSFMMGLPVPPVFFYLNGDSKYLVIDGQQRLRSIFFFFEGYFGEAEREKRKIFKLKGLDEKIRYANKAFNDFDAADKTKLEGCVLRAINIRQIKPSAENTSVYHIFERLNTGGTPLQPQEIRNCVFSGAFREELRLLNKDENWRKILGKSNLDKHQKDVELILRLFALLEQSPSAYEKPMKEFLNKAMQRNRESNAAFAKEFVGAFPEVCEKIIVALGAKPFHVRGPINAAYLDSMFCYFFMHRKSLPDKIGGKYIELKNNADFNEKFTRVSTTDTSILRERFSYVKKYFGAI